MKIITLAGLLVLTVHTLPAQIPDRVLQEWEILTSNGGTWIADNKTFMNENEPAEAYGVTWTYALDNKSVNGRLFGIKNGKDFGTFWEFRLYYHPTEKKVMYQQYGWGGVLGIAEMTFPDASHSVDVLTLHHPDGTTSTLKHEVETKGNTQYAQSYELKNGTWEKNRYYVWRKQ